MHWITLFLLDQSSVKVDHCVNLVASVHTLYILCWKVKVKSKLIIAKILLNGDALCILCWKGRNEQMVHTSHGVTLDELSLTLLTFM